MTTLPTTPTREEGGAKDSAEDLFYVTRQHIGWLKMFVIDMTSANWRDMRDRCEQQLNWLSDEINSHSTLTSENARLAERVRVLEGALEEIKREYRQYDTKGIDVMYQIAVDAAKSDGPGIYHNGKIQYLPNSTTERPRIYHKLGCVKINCAGCGNEWFSYDYSARSTPEVGE